MGLIRVNDDIRSCEFTSSAFYKLHIRLPNSETFQLWLNKVFGSPTMKFAYSIYVQSRTHTE